VIKWKKEMRKMAEKMIEKNVTLSGLTPILFDRYSGNNKEQLAVMDKIYLDGEKMVLPSTNILSFLSAQNTESAPQRVIGRGYKEVCKAAQSFVTISPFLIPFTRDGKQLTQQNANLKVHFAVAKIMKGKLAVPNPKERPMMETPWELTFKVSLLETPELNEVLLKKLFEKGGIAIGLGTFRGAFGKFKVAKWEAV
jgi:hypothetical protein